MDFLLDGPQASENKNGKTADASLYFKPPRRPITGGPAKITESEGKYTGNIGFCTKNSELSERNPNLHLIHLTIARQDCKYLFFHFQYENIVSLLNRNRQYDGGRETIEL